MQRHNRTAIIIIQYDSTVQQVWAGPPKKYLPKTNLISPIQRYGSVKLILSKSGEWRLTQNAQLQNLKNLFNRDYTAVRYRYTHFSCIAQHYILDSFLTKVIPEMVVSHEQAGGMEGRLGVHFKMSEEGQRVKQAYLWAIQGSKLAKMLVKRHRKSLANIMELYRHTQSSSCSPGLHVGPGPLVRIAKWLGKSSQQKQTTQDLPSLAVKLDSVLMYLCICVNRMNFLSWAIRLVLADPVTYILLPS